MMLPPAVCIEGVVDVDVDGVVSVVGVGVGVVVVDAVAAVVVVDEDAMMQLTNMHNIQADWMKMMIGIFFFC